jgi:hypothetical protein
MFRAAHRSSSGALNCICSLWFIYPCSDRPLPRLSGRPPYGHINQRLQIQFLPWRYNSDRFLAFSTISFHLRRSWNCSAHFINFVYFMSFLTSSSLRDLGLLAGLPVNSLHLCILLTVLVLGVLFMCPNQLDL